MHTLSKTNLIKRKKNIKRDTKKYDVSENK